MKDWLSKWGLWILLVLTFGVYLISRLLPTSKKKESILWKAKDGARKIKDDVKIKIERLNEKRALRKKEITVIRQLKDAAERRRLLAELANRKDAE